MHGEEFLEPFGAPVGQVWSCDRVGQSVAESNLETGETQECGAWVVGAKWRRDVLGPLARYLSVLAVDQTVERGGQRFAVATGDSGSPTIAKRRGETESLAKPTRRASIRIQSVGEVFLSAPSHVVRRRWSLYRAEPAGAKRRSRWSGETELRESTVCFASSRAARSVINARPGSLRPSCSWRL